MKFAVKTFDSDGPATNWMNDRAREGYEFVALSTHASASNYSRHDGRTIIMRKG